MNSLAEIAGALRDTNTISITAHIRPDGDAVGACLGLSRILRAAGKATTVIDLGPLPDRYRFLIMAGECNESRNIDRAATDCIVVLDTGAIDRVPPFVSDWKSTIPVINIDHHLANTNFGQLNHVDTTASSAGELVCNLAQAAGLTVNTKAAEALWVAIVTDTGRFSYSNTTPKTMQAAAALLSTGIDTAAINHAIYNAMPLRQLQLQGRALSHLETHEGGRVAVVSLSRQDYIELGCTAADAEDIVNLPRSLEGVEVAIFLYELLDEPETKVSLRTGDAFDAAAFCRGLGGGGHARAAGCSLNAPLDTARADILQRVHTQWFAA